MGKFEIRVELLCHSWKQGVKTIEAMAQKVFQVEGENADSNYTSTKLVQKVQERQNLGLRSAMYGLNRNGEF